MNSNTKNMPLLTAIGFGMGLLGIGGGRARSRRASKEAAAAQKAIDNYDRQELLNAYAGLSVSTFGADLQREELARATATSVSALQQAGIRGLVGGLGRVQSINALQSRQIGADLDVQQKAIDQMRAQDETQIRQMMERREEQDLAGLGQQLNVALQNRATAQSDITQGLFGIAGAALGGGFGNLFGNRAAGGAGAPLGYTGYNPQTGTSTTF